MWSAGGTTGRNRISGSNFSSSSWSFLSSRAVGVAVTLLQQARFLVELLGARVVGDAHALHRVLLGDELALGVAGGQRLLGGVRVHRLGDLVDRVGVDLGAGHE